jgi:hypothetical protein
MGSQCERAATRRGIPWQRSNGTHRVATHTAPVDDRESTRHRQTPASDAPDLGRLAVRSAHKLTVALGGLNEGSAPAVESRYKFEMAPYLRQYDRNTP